MSVCSESSPQFILTVDLVEALLPCGINEGDSGRDFHEADGVLELWVLRAWHLLAFPSCHAALSCA